MITRRRVLIFSMLAAGGAFAAEPVAETFEPPTYAINRYEPVWKRSPFIVETVAVQVSQGLAQRFALAGVATINGEPMAMIVDRQEPVAAKARFLLSKEKASALGLELVSLTFNVDPRQTAVTVRQAGKEARLNYDPQVLAQMGGGGGGGGNAPAPVPAPNALPTTALPPAPANPAGGAAPPAPPPRRIIRPAPVNVN